MNEVFDSNNSEFATRAFQALSDPNRLRIVLKLKELGMLYTHQLLEQFEMSQPTLSYHMKALTLAQLVEIKREGRKVVYSLKKDNFVRLQNIFSLES